MQLIDKNKDALIVVDVQNDFCPGGALPVPEGDSVVPVIRRLAPHFRHIFATQDWHPPNHVSFVQFGGVWPAHCVAGTPGAELHPLLVHVPATLIRKATKVDADAYSGFEGTNLADLLNAAGIKRVYITGLATDYCVKATALDALRLGFDVVVVRDAVKGVDVSPGDSASALAEMEKAGAKILASPELVG